MASKTSSRSGHNRIIVVPTKQFDDVYIADDSPYRLKRPFRPIRITPVLSNHDDASGASGSAIVDPGGARNPPPKPLKRIGPPPCLVGSSRKTSHFAVHILLQPIDSSHAL